MDRIFIKNLRINELRHLKNLEIPISDRGMKHLLLTGVNGSGKTSLLTALSIYLDWECFFDKGGQNEEEGFTNANKYAVVIETAAENKTMMKQRVKRYWDSLHSLMVEGLDVKFNLPFPEVKQKYQKDEFIIAYYKDFRRFEPVVPKQIEKVEFEDRYDIAQGPGKDFLKYLLDMKMMQAMAVADGQQEDADLIKSWFDQFTGLLRKIYANDQLELQFDREHYNFQIDIPGRDTFDFLTMSSGYEAAIDIVIDLMMRMEKKTQKRFRYDLPGIVLIDEIETHLHLSLQKEILGILTGIFPNIQFIVSTHSPFVLNSMENVVIYDLENRTLVKNGLADIPYEGVVEGYFKVDGMSEELKRKFDRYKLLTLKEDLTDEEELEIYTLEHDLDEIPDFLALSEAAEFERMKLEYHNRREASANG